MWLRQSTASQEVLLGPFLDSTDGNTQKTALTIANTDIKVWKDGGTTEASKNSGGATHIANGRYYAVLDATDTNTLGNLEINVHATGALAVRRQFIVLPANVYDSLLLGTDYLDVSAVQLSGQTITAGAGVTFPSSVASPTNITAGTITTATNLTNLPAIAAGWLTASGIAAGALNGKGDWNIGKTGFSLTQTFPTNFSAMSISAGGLVDILQSAADKAWGTTTRVLTAGTNIALAKGTGVTGFNDLSSSGVESAVWDATMASHLTAGTTGAALNGASAPSAATVASAVWDAVLASHLTAGSTGYALNAAGAAGDPWTTALPGAYGAGSAGNIIGNYVPAINTKAGFLPSATAGAAGGLVIAGSNAAMTVDITGTISTVTTLTNKTGFSLSTAGIQAIWDALTSALTTAGSIGKRISDFLTGDAFVRLGAPAGASTAADIAAAKVDTAAIKAKTDNLTFTGAGRVDANLTAINNSTAHLTAFDRAVAGNVIGTVGAGSTTTSVVSSALTPAGSVSTQFKGRLIIFADNTTTAALRGQATDITASTAAATPTFTVTALTTAPVSGDTFVLV